MQISINPRELAAISLAASSEATRYYLNGVLIEVYKEDSPDTTPDALHTMRAGEAGLVAIDGHRLMALHTSDKPQLASFIIPRDICAQLFKQYQGAGKVHKTQARGLRYTIDYDPETGGLVITLTLFDQVVSVTHAKAIDGTFPDWRRVIPSADAEEPQAGAAFNTSLLDSFVKAGKLIAGSRAEGVKLVFTGAGNPLRVQLPFHKLGEEFIGMLLPMRA